MENEAATSNGSPKLSEGIVGWIESVIIATTQTSVGQALFKLIDSFLWVVEKSAQWSLPSHEVAAEENGKVFGKIDLVRPLPWILFLPGLVILRVIRSSLNLGAFFLGYPQIQPSGMVKFVQRSRRRLRAINLKAVKSSRRRTCAKVSTPDEKSTTESAGSPIHAEMKRKFSQVSSDEESSDESQNETLQSKLDRLAMEESTDDPDFNPNDCSTESTTTSSENEVDKDVSLNELADVRDQANDLLKSGGDTLSLLMTLENLKSNMKSAEDTAIDAKLVDSSETDKQSTSQITSDFINGEIKSAVEVPSSGASGSTSAPSSTSEVTNGKVCEKQNRKEASAPSSHSRTFFSKDHSSNFPEKKYNKHKKGGRRDYK